jgi:hypothetical protein
VHEKAERHENKDMGPREQHQIASKDATDCAAGANHRHRRDWVLECLGKGRRNAAQQIKYDESYMPHRVLYVIRKNPEVEHIPKQVHEAAVPKKT